MLNQIPLQLISNFVSIVLLGILLYRYFQYKKNMDVVEGLVKLKDSNELSEQDKEFIDTNENEYRVQLIKTEGLIKLSKPFFILLVGVIFIFFPFADAVIHLNVVVVAFIFMQVDKTHKANLYKLLFDLKKED
ncbi:MAG: hypothetical protein ACPG9K_05435 [Poseidonibacter sp.]